MILLTLYLFLDIIRGTVIFLNYLIEIFFYTFSFDYILTRNDKLIHNLDLFFWFNEIKNIIQLNYGSLLLSIFIYFDSIRSVYIRFNDGKFDFINGFNVCNLLSRILIFVNDGNSINDTN